MRINNNIMAMNTHRQYSINTASVAKSTEKLSSGYRVNRAGDDAAGLAISEKMRAQIRGLRMASKNSSDAISLVQTAEGALQESHNILQRMRELATQSSSDTNETSIDRSALDAEFQQLIKELDDTAGKTKFNDMGVIDGTFSKGAAVQDATATANAPLIGSVFFNQADTTEDAVVAGATATDIDTLMVGTSDEYTLTENDLKAGSHTIRFSNGTSFSYQLSEDVDFSDATALEKFRNDLVSSADFSATDLISAKNPLTIQTGANQGDTLEISIGKMDAHSLGLRKDDLTTYNITTGKDARDAISICNQAINQVSTERSKMGALQNRLNHKISNLDTSAENLSSAESRIRDLDMAQEMTNFTRNNILTQASTAMLAQANMAPQSVLSLIG